MANLCGKKVNNTALASNRPKESACLPVEADSSRLQKRGSKRQEEQRLQRDPGSEAERNESVSDISNFQDPIPHLGEKQSFKMAQVSSADTVAMREQRKKN